jgi:hypothetical protein
MDSYKKEDAIRYSLYSDIYSITENFESHGFNPDNKAVMGNTIIANQITPLTDISTDYSNKLLLINKNYLDLSSNISQFNTIRSDLSGNKLYDYNTPFTLTKPKTVLDGLIYDNQQLNIQEKSIYVLGTITAATLIILAIIIGKE